MSIYSIDIFSCPFLSVVTFNIMHLQSDDRQLVIKVDFSTQTALLRFFSVRLRSAEENVKSLNLSKFITGTVNT